MIKQTIKLFNKALPVKNPLSFQEVNKIASKFGYIVHPDVCSIEVIQWMNEQSIDYNSSFYKNWNEIVSRSRFELYIDQLCHYASTYGTNYTGDAYVPDAKLEIPDLNKFKLILPITKEDLINKCEKMLFSGIALSQATIDDLFIVIDSLNHQVDVSLVKNKEAKMMLYKKLNVLPTEPVEMMRFLIYLVTGKTLLIKDGNTIAQIKKSTLYVESFISLFGEEAMSSIFYRFKPLFLAFRANAKNKECINRLRRLAIKNHKPLKEDVIAKLLVNYDDNDEYLLKRIEQLNNFKKIGLLQTINVREKKGNDFRAFLIRNQKLFMKEGKAPMTVNVKLLKARLYKSLIQSLSKKATTVKLPKGIELTLPVSEKSFVGNFPVGSSIDFSKTDNIIGIHWKGKDGAQDLDLKLIDIDGNQFGWNAAYKNNSGSIVFSGDMTSAHPEASEMFYTSKGFKPAILKVNLFNGAANSKFKMFIAREKVVNFGRNYMVNPNNILVEVECEMDSKEKQLGVITDSRFILAQFRTGKGRVAGDSVTNNYTNYALRTLDCYLPLRQVLHDAGFTFVEDEPAIDLTVLSKDTLIDLFS